MCKVVAPTASGDVTMRSVRSAGINVSIPFSCLATLACALDYFFVYALTFSRLGMFARTATGTAV